MSDTYTLSDFAVYVNDLTKLSSEENGDGNGLYDLSFSFKKKGIHCILAPRRSGKTRIMNILCGCEAADSGEVCIFGADPYNNRKAKKKIGYLREDNTLYSNMTVFEIMDFVGGSRGVESGKLYRQIKEALDLAGLEELKNKLVSKLTAYERKKLSVAAALLGNPDVLLLDEPITKHMGDDKREELEEIIKMLGRIKTVVITTDDCSVARALAEDVVIISDGRVLAKGSFEELDRRLLDSENPITLEELYNTLTSASAE